MMNHRDLEPMRKNKIIKMCGRRNKSNGLMRSDNIRKYMFLKDDISRNMYGV